MTRVSTHVRLLSLILCIVGLVQTKATVGGVPPFSYIVLNIFWELMLKSSIVFLARVGFNGVPDVVRAAPYGIQRLCGGEAMPLQEKQKVHTWKK